MLSKNIFLLWIQGWENAKWINLQVAESWKINNPNWTIHYIDLINLKDYVNDIDYIYNEYKDISYQAKSDIIRLSLLKNYGGVWADATMLCMQPLDHWVHEAVEPSGLWVYHCPSGNEIINNGPACWFIVSKKNDYMINEWKNECDNYWLSNNHIYEYFWLDEWFHNLLKKDDKFNELWSKTPFLFCEYDGQSHTLAHHKMENNTSHIKKLFLEKPPYVLKLWKYWDLIFPDINSEECKNSNAYYAIELSKRKFCYKHVMQ